MDYKIDIPGNADVKMEIGDTLRIHFKTPAKFCIDSGNKDAFDQPLPVGQKEAEGWWPSEYGKPAKAISDTTIKYCHVAPDKECEPCNSPILGGPGTIKVGTGIKHG